MSADTSKTPAFDPRLLTQLLADRKTPGEIEDLLKGLRKAFIEHALEGELTDLLGYPKHHPEGRGSGNSRNGFSRKTVKTDDSEIEVNIPRDRNAIPGWLLLLGGALLGIARWQDQNRPR